MHRDCIYQKYGLTEETIDDICSLLYEGSTLTEDVYTVDEIQEDLADNKFLSCAIEGIAEYVVSGDKHSF